jgi:outer membrane receptor protein involved in Fe transport
MLRYGLELLHEKFSISARMLHVGKQRISAFVDDVNPGARHTLNGYQLLNISARYRLLKLLSVFVNIDNALNQSATTIADGVNLGTSPSPFYSGNPQNPVRLMGGLTFNW